MLTSLVWFTKQTEIISLLGINRLIFEWGMIVFIDLYEINVHIYFRLNSVFKAVSFLFRIALRQTPTATLFERKIQ